MDKLAITDESGNFLPEMIGSDEDFAVRKEDREKRSALVAKGEWAALEAAEKSIKRGNLMREGFHAGYESAADDYSNGKVDLRHFEKLRSERDLTDFYALGFEIGYFRKLAEILVG